MSTKGNFKHLSALIFIMILAIGTIIADMYGTNIPEIIKVSVEGYIYNRSEGARDNLEKLFAGQRDDIAKIFGIVQSSPERVPYEIPPREDITDGENGAEPGVADNGGETGNEPETPPASEPQPQETQPEEEVPTVLTFDDTLFIGDSRMVGIKEYGGIEGADFFCDVGLSSYNIETKKIEVGEYGKLTLEELLSIRQYGKIFVMIGINDLGYDRETSKNLYVQHILSIRDAQPDAEIFIMNNIPVTSAASAVERNLNNQNIITYNNMLLEVADSFGFYYVDSYWVLADENGGLDPSIAGDKAHPTARGYIEWTKWLVRYIANMKHQLIPEGWEEG